MAQVAFRYEETEKAQIIGFPQVEQPKEARPNNKKKGKKSEVFAFTTEDERKVVRYFREHNMDIHYLIYVICDNLVRRIGDTLNMRWENLYNPETGKFRTHLEIVEEKTGKPTRLKINDAVKDAVTEYIEKYNVDVTKNNYTDPVFIQLTGTHRGKVITQDGYRKALKKAAAEVGIEYNVGTHSARKTFGKFSRELHPNDHDSMSILQRVFNHSSERITQNYIGLTQEKVDQYMDDRGEAFKRYIIGDEDFHPSGKTVVNIDINDLRDLVPMIYEEALRDAGVTVPAHKEVETVNAFWGIIDSLTK